jgi:hypothetical protein
VLVACLGSNFADCLFCCFETEVAVVVDGHGRFKFVSVVNLTLR